MNKPTFSYDSKAVQQSYETIGSFFDMYGTLHPTIFLSELIESCMSYKPKKLNPANVIFFFEQVEKLTLAAIVLSKHGNPKVAAIAPPDGVRLPNPVELESYSLNAGPSVPWEDFPRFLSSKEFFNPYSVLDKVADLYSKKDWKIIIKALRDYTFSKCRFTELWIDANIIKVHFVLCKMIEAAHLIHIRTIKAGNQRIPIIS